MMYGLEQEQLKQIKRVFASYPKIDRVILFGSRAKGNYKAGSDIDLALLGDDLKLQDLLYLYNELEKLDMLYKFDLVIYNRIKEPELVAHIDRVGKEIYLGKLAA